MSELTLEQFTETFASLRGDMATKSDIASVHEEMATKTDIAEVRTEIKTGLENLRESMEEYTDQVATTILDSMDANFQSLRRRLDMRDHKMNRIDSEVKELKSALMLE